MATATKKAPVKSKTKVKYTKAQYMKWYESMYLMRKFEEKAGQLYIQQKFGGFCHLYNGQEAVVAGAVSATKKGDKHITAYRDHAHGLGLGMSPNVVMAELYGKVTGCTKGKGGSMHIFDIEKGLWGGHGIVGAQIPMGAGIAFAEKYNKTKNVCITSFGDGAARQGALHETFNMAMTWKLPVIFVIENNQYAMGTSIERTTNVTDLSKMGLSYDMPSETVDGMNVEAVHEAFEVAVARARKGDGPTLLNIETYRYKGHSMSDAQKYRTKDEIKKYQEIDPITSVLKTIRTNKFATEKQIEKIHEKVKKQVEEAVIFAEESPKPEAHELYEDVYAEPDYPFIKEYI